MVPLKILLLNTLSYFLLTLDIRWTSVGKMPHCVILAALIGVLSFTILKDVQASNGIIACAAYASGGTLGTYLGVIFTKRFFTR